MAYSIGYGHQMQEQARQRGGNRLHVLVVLVIAAILGVHLFFLTGISVLQHAVFPLQEEDVAALTHMTQSVAAGVPISEAVRVFCQEIIDHAALPQP
jgi:hypothetical protein